MAAVSRTALRPRLAGLYVLTPDLADTAALAARAGLALSGGASAIQYRNKSAPPALKRQQAVALRSLCSARGATFIVNDDIELAHAVDADGVHLGRDDASIAAARARLGPAAIVGVSCYDQIERAEAAIAAGGDYIAFGSFYPSLVKPDAVRPPLRLIAEAKARWPDISVVAIGGITAANAAPLIEAGADAVAVISAVYDAPDVASAARELVACFR
ncbi:MAG TPA: thiamine phosphate synthase [Casimicrobiaceae bacterium]|nr:thiamine phosphate synthase [Casimicrobiaceae bacterium]